jgi:apolipoprotein N-acyltransferase
VLEVNGTGYGVFICYDIVDDSLARDAARGDAGVLLAPTNNADFGRSDESAQQLATARLRAVEAGKPLVQASTVGWSAAYAADGTELAALDWYEPGAFVVEVQPASGLTPATAFGEGIDVLLGGLGLALLLGAPRALLPGTSRALQFGGSRGNATRANG